MACFERAVEEKSRPFFADIVERPVANQPFFPSARSQDCHRAIDFETRALPSLLSHRHTCRIIRRICSHAFLFGTAEMTVPPAPIPDAIPSVGEIWVIPMSKRVTLVSGRSPIIPAGPMSVRQPHVPKSDSSKGGGEKTRIANESVVGQSARPARLLYTGHVFR